MRPKLVIAVLIVGAAATTAWLLSGRRAAEPTDIEAPPAVGQTPDLRAEDTSPGGEQAAGAPAEPPAPAVEVKEGVTNPDPAMVGTPEAQQEDNVAKRVAELQDLGMEDDPASLETILSELNNGDPSIRQAAVEAAVQFGSRDAIPRLADAAAQTSDPEEKAAILEAIEFLKLPTLTEALGQTNPPAEEAPSGTNSPP